MRRSDAGGGGAGAPAPDRALQALSPTGRASGNLIHRLRAAPPLLVWGWIAGLTAYLTVLALTSGLHPAFVVASLAVVFLSVWTPWTQRLLAGATPFLAQGVFYELTRFLQPALRLRHVHVREPYLFDRTLFGIHTAAGILTPNELLARHHCALVDFLTGIPYILYTYEVLGFLIFLSLTREEPGRLQLFYRCGWAFFVMCLGGYTIYYLYPAAPPWYVAQHGFAAPDFANAASAASAGRWDALTGIPYFHWIYGLTVNVFAAIPSLHVAFATIVVLYVDGAGKRWMTVGCVLLYFLMCFAAVYLQHHYVLDVLAGAALAFGAFGIERAASLGLRFAREHQHEWSDGPESAHMFGARNGPVFPTLVPVPEDEDPGEGSTPPTLHPRRERSWSPGSRSLAWPSPPEPSALEETLDLTSRDPEPETKRWPPALS